MSSRIDDILHQSGHSHSERYRIVLQIIVLKWALETRVPAMPAALRRKLHAHCDANALRQALPLSLAAYASVLPRRLHEAIRCGPHVLEQLWEAISNLELTTASPDILQNFFMRFGSAAEKSRLAQHFTAPELIDFVIAIVNPRAGECVLEIASGTADFLIGAHRWVRGQTGTDASLRLVGIELAPETADLARLNLFVHGVTDAIIVDGDVLELVNKPSRAAHAPP